MNWIRSFQERIKAATAEGAGKTFTAKNFGIVIAVILCASVAVVFFERTVAYRSEVARLSEELKTVDTKSDGLRTEIEEGRRLNQELKAQLDRKIEEMEVLSQKYDAEIRIQDEKRASLEALLTETGARLNQARLERDELKTRLDQATRENIGLMSYMNTLLASKDDLRGQLDAMKRERRRGSVSLGTVVIQKEAIE